MNGLFKKKKREIGLTMAAKNIAGLFFIAAGRDVIAWSRLLVEHSITPSLLQTSSGSINWSFKCSNGDDACFWNSERFYSAMACGLSKQRAPAAL